MSHFRKFVSASLLGILVLVLCAVSAQAKTNYILMIVDGGGQGIFRISSIYRTGEDRGLPFMKQDDGWKEFGCTTFSFKGAVQNTKVVDGEVIKVLTYSEDGSYSPNTHWKTFRKHMENATDSAAATTALNTGSKTNNGRINYDSEGNPLETTAQYAFARGFAAGSVTNVMASHATPAGVASHNMKRGDGGDLWREMVKKEDSVLSVVIGASHPWYNSNGDRRDEPKRIEYGPSMHAWGHISEDESYYGWKFIEKREDFQKIANGEMKPPKKLMGLPMVSSCFQSQRSKEERTETVPTLGECCLASLNVLNQNEKGFYLQVESGSIDWLAHGNANYKKICFEMDEFYDAVEAICEWVEKNSSWEETTLIITADHDTGSLMGPEADQEDTLFQAPINNGKGKEPGYKYYTRSHTNAPVPFYVKGQGAKKFAERVRCIDSKYGEIWGFKGEIVDNTDVSMVGKELFEAGK